MNIILKKLGPVSNINFDKLFFGQLFAHFSDAIVQFTLVAVLLDKLPELFSAFLFLNFCSARLPVLFATDFQEKIFYFLVLYFAL